MFRFIYNQIKNNLKKIKFVRLLLYKIKSEYKKYQVFNFLKKDSVFIDLGANIGNVSTYINDKFGCKIFCYEPHPSAYNYLKKKLGKYKNITTINCAVSNQTSEQDIYLHKDSSKQNDLFYAEATSLEKNKENISLEKKIKTKCIHISEILKKFNYIDCIKIDIEGHEYKILPFLIENKNMIKKVICELHGNSTYDSGDIKNAFLKPEYDKTIEILKEKNLYKNWFLEWE